MSRRTLALAAALVGALCGVVVWLAVRRSHGDAEKVAPLRRAPAVKTPTDKVTIKGTVYEQEHGNPVAAVTVVLLGKTGEVKTTTGADGTFSFTVPRGIYRAFVRDLDMITTGLQERQRLDSGPRVELVGALDEALVPVLDAATDLDHIELGVTRTAVISGTLLDDNDRPIAGAVVRARQQPTLDATLRPVIGSDVTFSDPLGKFLLRVPAGEYFVDAHHSKYAASLPGGPLSVDPGQHEEVHVEMTPGCVVRGKVVMADGKTPAPDGAIETDLTGTSFSPSSRVNVDGTFELAQASGGLIRVRAWPWRSAPSEPKVFECQQGSRFENVVLKLQEWPVELGGTLVDANGAPVPYAFVDMRGLDGGLSGQQERTDAAGTFRIFDVLAGRYKLTATAAGRGIVETTVVAPKTDVQLQLAGTGRIAGTTTDLIDGSIEVSFLQCGNDADPIELAPEPRIVPVHGGRFIVDGAPACGLRFVARWRNRTVEQQIVVEPGGTAHVTLALGTPHEKTVHGTVRDSHGAPAADVRVTALFDSKEAATVRTDPEGRYTLTTRSGAEIVAGSGAKVGHGAVGRANVPGEVVDLVLDSDQ